MLRRRNPPGTETVGGYGCSMCSCAKSSAFTMNPLPLLWNLVTLRWTTAQILCKLSLKYITETWPSLRSWLPVCSTPLGLASYCLTGSSSLLFPWYCSGPLGHPSQWYLTALIPSWETYGAKQGLAMLLQLYSKPFLLFQVLHCPEVLHNNFMSQGISEYLLSARHIRYNWT